MMPKTNVNDLEIYYELKGKGFPIVLIMGIGTASNCWSSRLIQKLSESFQVVLFDNRGSGRTEKKDGVYSIETFAKDTVCLMEYLNIGPAHILGLSMGGLIAQDIAIGYPNMVEKLILCSTNCGFAKSALPSPDFLKSITHPKEGLSPEEKEREDLQFVFTTKFIRENPSLIEEYIQRRLKYPTPPEYYKRQLDAVVKFNSYRRLKEIKKPTLIMQGAEDLLSPPQNARLLAEKISGATLRVYENIGHNIGLAIFSQESEPVISDLLKFLNQR